MEEVAGHDVAEGLLRVHLHLGEGRVAGLVLWRGAQGGDGHLAVADLGHRRNDLKKKMQNSFNIHYPARRTIQVFGGRQVLIWNLFPFLKSFEDSCGFQKYPIT